MLFNKVTWNLSHWRWICELRSLSLSPS